MTTLDAIFLNFLIINSDWILTIEKIVWKHIWNSKSSKGIKMSSKTLSEEANEID